MLPRRGEERLKENHSTIYTAKSYAKNKQGYFVPHVGDIIMMGSRHVVQFSTPVMSVSRAYLQPEYLVIKRAIDIIVSLNN